MSSRTKSRPAESVDEVIMSLPRSEQVIVKRLRALILECLPKATEKISYRVPFYKRHRMICFIWPPSIYWGPKKQWNDKEEKGVTLGFCQGNLMSNFQTNNGLFGNSVNFAGNKNGLMWNLRASEKKGSCL